MYESAERLKQREVRTALAKLNANGEVTDEQEEIIESLADSLIGQLLSAPTKSLREAAADDDWTTIQTAMQLFDPEFDIQPGETELGSPDDADTTADPSAAMPSSMPDSPEDLPDGVEDEIPQHVLEQLSND